MKMYVSLPLWERGLKFTTLLFSFPAHASLPLWERGLKLQKMKKQEWKKLVAPLVGAWIEIRLPPWAFYFCILSLPLWERGLKL